MRSVLRCALPLVPLLLIGCSREPTSSPPPPPVAGPAGLMEITITGIGTPQQKASVRSISQAAVPARSAGTVVGGPSRAARIILSGRLSQLPDTSATIDGTVELVPVSTASFTWGTRTGGGYRYVSATYKVRNASKDSTAYGDARTNLTFMAVSTPSTLSGTAISTLRKFDNTNITSGLETSVLPTGWADLSSTATLTARGPDVLQVYTEAEVAAVGAITGITSIQPYGFVVGNPSTSNSRTLPANPAASQFDGLVTFAFKVPLQATAADDPFTISGMFLAMDDNQTVVTQSFEEADATSVTALQSRATALGAQLRGVVGPTIGVTPATLECRVRIAGTSGTPTAFMADSAVISSESPAAFTSAASFIDSTGNLSVTIAQTMSGATSANFVVNSGQGGRAFIGGTYGGAGTATLSTPASHFWPGDYVEVALTPSLSGTAAGARVCPGFVYRYRVQTATATANDTAATVSPTTGSGPLWVAAGDLNGDHKLDLVVANDSAGTVSVLLGDGTGAFTEASGSPITIGGGTQPHALALADFNGDGKLDIAVDNFGTNNVTVLLGNGSGGFTAASGSPITVGSGPYAIAVGDFNGDGKLDIVVPNSGSTNLTVLLGNGSGGFTAAPNSPFEVGGNPTRVAVGDFNRDGKLDLVAGLAGSAGVAVLLGNGTGGFAAASGSPFPMGGNTGPQSVAVGDLNGDGNLDIASAAFGDNLVRVLLGNGAGGFSPASGSPSSVGTQPFDVRIADLNGDGKLDVVSVNNVTNNVTVLPGDGTGGFGTAITIPVGNAPRAEAIGDFNGDGMLDLVTANFAGSRTLTILLNR